MANLIYYILPLSIVFLCTYLISKNKNIKVFTIKNLIVASILVWTILEVKSYSHKYIDYLYYSFIFYVIINYLLSFSQEIFYIMISMAKRKIYFLFIAVDIILLSLTILYYNINLTGVFDEMDKYINLVIIVVLCVSLGIKEKYENDDKFGQFFSKSKQITNEYNIIKISNNLNLIKHILAITICSAIFISIVFTKSIFIYYSGIIVNYVMIFYLNSFNYEMYLFNDKIKFIIKENQEYIEKIIIS